MQVPKNFSIFTGLNRLFVILGFFLHIEKLLFDLFDDFLFVGRIYCGIQALIVGVDRLECGIYFQHRLQTGHPAVGKLRNLRVQLVHFVYGQKTGKDHDD